MHTIAEAENAVVLTAAEQDADERNFRKDYIDRVSGHERAADVDLVVFEIDPALGRQSYAWIVDDAVLDRELARATLKGRRHLLKTNARRVDRGSSPFRCALRRSADQLAKRRFVAQDEVGERSLAGAQIAARAEKQIEVAPFEMRIEIGETEKRAGVGRRDPRFPAASGRGHRATADSSAQASQSRFAAAPRSGELHAGDRLLVGARDARDLGVEVEILRRRLSGRAAVQNRFDEGAGVERSAAARSLERSRTIDDVDLEIVAGRDARLSDRGALDSAGGVHLSRPPEHRHAQFDSDVAKRSALWRGHDEERRLARFSRRLRDPRDGIVDACRREVDFDLRAGAGQRRLELDRERS